MTTPEPTAPDTAGRPVTEDTAHALVEELAKFTDDSGQQLVNLARWARWNRRMIWALVVSVAFTLVLSAAVAVVAVVAVGNYHRTADLAHRLDVSQTTTRTHTLCPLYQLLKDSETGAARAAAPDKVAYDHSVMVINEGYAALGCAAVVHPSPSPTAP
jgi:Na+-transporting methylmalonyl-CoA/oxaloacetate decarboxylase beta subunit